MRISNTILTCAIAALLLAAAGSAADVAIERQPGPWLVSADTYQVTIGDDGNLISLQVDGVEFLEHDTELSRATYFWHNKTFQLSDVQTPAPNVITASGDEASVRYQFADDSMVWTVKNNTEAPVSFFMVFHPDVEAVQSGEGDLELTVVNETWEKTTWFRGKSRLQITGSTKQWGPWAKDHQIWEASLAPGEERRIEFSMGPASPDVIEAIEDLKSPLPTDDADLTVLSPRSYQVFQRRTETEGDIVISGRALVPCDRLEIRILGQPLRGEISDDWREVPGLSSGGGFNARWTIPAGGWYRLEARALQGGDVVAEATVDNFGLGEVFVGAGQSNSTNAGQFKTKQTSGMVSSFSGRNWQLADDPQPGPHDNSQGGSYYPAFGDALYQRYRVPIGVAVTGHGGTAVSQWQPAGELFEWMMVRIHQLGPQGFRAVLWHQGESDVQMDPDEYFGKLKQVIVSSKAAAGWEFPWFVARASYHNAEHPSWPNVREAQKLLWDAGVALEGPDTDTLTSEYRDYDGKGIHFSPKGLQAHGLLWADKVGGHLDAVLAPHPAAR